jgi:Fe2+ or Zn2+ uptake regulation protein
MATICKHPRVRIVSRHEDAEFFECLECGEVFDSEEFRDMEIEENAETEQASEETEQAAGETESAAKRS